MEKYLDWSRQALGGVCFSLFWLYPLAGGPSPVAEPLIVALMLLAVGAMFIGFGAMSRGAMVSSALLGALFVSFPTAYLQNRVIGVLAVVGFAMSLMVSSRLKQEGRANEFLAWLLLVAGGISAFIGMLQYFGLEGELWPWVVDAPGRGIAFGNLRQRNLFAMLMNSSLVSLFWLMKVGRISLPAGSVATVVFCYAIAASASRIGLLGLLAIPFFSWFLLRGANGNIRGLMLLVPLIYAVAAYSLPWLAWLHGFDVVALPERVRSMSAGDSRLAIWSNALDMISMRPWLGWGWRDFGYAHFVANFDVRSKELLDNAHNLPLHLGVEFGLIVAALILGGVVYWVWGLRPWRVGAGEEGLAWALVILLLLHSMVEYPLWFAPNIFLMGYCAAILGGAPSVGSNLAFIRVLGASCCALIFGFAVFAKLAYNQVAWVYSMPVRGDAWSRQISLDLSRGNWLFEPQLDFSRIGVTMVNIENAAIINRDSERLLHFSAEPHVLERLIESEKLMGGDRYNYWVKKYEEVFSDSFRRWRMSCGAIGCKGVGRPTDIR